MINNKYAVIDTNVIVSALLTTDNKSPTYLILKMITERRIIPIVNKEIIEEYKKILNYNKFNFDKEKIKILINYLENNNVKSYLKDIKIDMKDIFDLPFYLAFIDMHYLDPYLITGNKKHFPSNINIVSPREFIDNILHFNN